MYRYCFPQDSRDGEGLIEEVGVHVGMGIV